MKLNLSAAGTISVAVTAALGLFASSASAVTLNGTSGTWSNVKPGNNPTLEFRTVGNENQVRWGNPAPDHDKSGLGFAGVGQSIVELGETFLLGSLNHFNNPVADPVAESADLNIKLDFASAALQSFAFNFAIDETPNEGVALANCSYASATPCADKISFSSALSSNSMNIDGKEYKLQLLGFSETVGGDSIDSFISQEGKTNTAYLSARLAAVPEPATVAGLSLLGVYFAARRRGQKAKAASRN